MTDQEIRETIGQMLRDWDAATPEQRAEALTKAAKAAAEAKPPATEAPAAAAPPASSAPTVKVGDIFVRSWGYDQTNVNFYEIVEVSKTGKTAKARRVNNATIPTDDDSPYSRQSDRVVPATGPNRFSFDADRCSRCSNRHRDDGPGWDGHAFSNTYTWQARFDRVTDDWDHAYRWDGEPEYQTASGWGH